MTRPLRVGDKVSYRAWGDVASTGHTIIRDPWRPNSPKGAWVCMISGMRHWVLVDSLTLEDSNE